MTAHANTTSRDAPRRDKHASKVAPAQNDMPCQVAPQRFRSGRADSYRQALTGPRHATLSQPAPHRQVSPSPGISPRLAKPSRAQTGPALPDRLFLSKSDTRLNTPNTTGRLTPRRSTSDQIDVARHVHPRARTRLGSPNRLNSPALPLATSDPPHSTIRALPFRAKSKPTRHASTGAGPA